MRGISCVALGLLFAIAGLDKRSAEKNSREAIISAPNVYVKSSPDQGGKDLFILHEGIKVDMTDQVGEWTEVKLSDGKEGWLPKASLEEI